MNRNLMYFAVSSISGISAIVVSVPSFATDNVFAFGTRADNTPNNTHIVLDKSNQPTITTSGSDSLTYNEYALSYLGVSSNATGVDS